MPEEDQQKKAKAVVISRQDLTEEEAHDYIEQHETEQEGKRCADTVYIWEN